MAGFPLRIAGCSIVVALTVLLAVHHFRGGLGQASPYVSSSPAASGVASVPNISPFTPSLALADEPCTGAEERRAASSRRAPETAEPSERDAGRDVHGVVEPRRLTPASPFAPDELLVRYRAGITVRERQATNARFGASEVERLDRLHVSRVRLPAGSDVRAAARALTDHPLIEFAQPNFCYSASIEPTDPAYTEIQHWYYHVTNAPAGWDIETGSEDVIVAVVDTGVNATHPDLDDQIWVNPGEIAGNSIDDDGNGCVDDVHGCDFTPSPPSGDPEDDFGHGTFVSGTACAETNNGVSGAGTAFDCTIMAVKVLSFGGGTGEDIAEGILYAAENGADIINMSLGTFCIPGGPPFSDPVMEAAMQTAHDTFGVAIVAAAGNADQGCVSFPASDPNAIAVGASDFLHATDGRAPFSQWGPEIAVAAPGLDIVGPVPPALCGNMGQCLSDGRTEIASGTSFSAPQVAGLAALLLSQDPSRTNEDLRTIMQNSARDLPDDDTPNWDGAGRIDVSAALGGDSVFAKIGVGHGFPPVLRLSLGVGDPSAPTCQDVLVNFPPIQAFRVNGSFGVSECASSWPPSAGTPWFLKGVDADIFPDNGNINAFTLDSAGQLCTAYDTPVPIPDDVPAGGVSMNECLPVPELSAHMSPPAAVLLGDPIEYEILVTNQGSVVASPVIVRIEDDPSSVGTKLFQSPPADCSLDGNTSTCDLGALASGESTSVLLTADTLSGGLITKCVTVDPDDLIAEGIEDNNQDCNDTNVVAIPPPTFTNSDPVGDTNDFFEVAEPDIVELRGAFDATTFYLTVEFAGPVDPADAGTAQALNGFIDFDTDQDPETGFFPSEGEACNPPPGAVGSDVFADLGDVSAGSLPLIDGATFETIDTAPIVFTGNAFHALLPLSALDGDNALDLTMAVAPGSFFFFDAQGFGFYPSDCAPNNTILTCAGGNCEKGPLPPPPPNDNFGNATQIEAKPLPAPYTDTQDTVTATLEPGEPRPCPGIDKTVWYAFTPNQNVLLVADTAGSEFGFATALAAYTGDSLPTLQLIDCVGAEGGFFSNGHFEPSQQRLAFAASAGETYYFQAGYLFEESGSLVFNLTARADPPCSPKTNLGFEAGPPDTDLIPCWTVVDQAGSGGAWCNQTGIFAPQGSCMGNFTQVLSPPAGVQTAMTNSFGYPAGSHLLYRCGELASDTISFQLYLNNQAGEFASPLSLDYRRFPNQQFRADLVTSAGLAADPFTIRPADILLNLYQTQPGDPPFSGYDRIQADAAAFVGDQVCLRFAEVNNLYVLNIGIDEVEFAAAKDPNADSDGDTTPNGTDLDDDNDGCTDQQEAGLNAVVGGRRNPHNLWDFFDTPPRDRIVNLPDIGRVVARFGSTGDQAMDPFSAPPAAGYHTAFDRTVPGPELWDLGPPDGRVAVQDIGLVVAQFGHSCAA